MKKGQDTKREYSLNTFAAKGLSGELLYPLFWNSPIGIYVLQDGCFAAVNPRFTQLTGYDEEELIGRYALDLVVVQDREHVRRSAREALNHRNLTPYEYRVQRKDKTTLWVMETVTSINYEKRRAVLGYFMDIQARKEAEEALRESEERYRQLFENANDIIYIHDLNGRFTHVNRAGEEISGYTLQEAKNLHFLDVVSPEYHHLARKVIPHHLFSGITNTYELVLLTKEGRRVPVEVKTSLLRKNGNPFAIQGIARDITERKVMEEQLKAANQRLADIIDFLPDATFVVDRQKKIIAWNKAMEQLTGISKAEMLGKPQLSCANLFHGRERYILVDFILDPHLDPEPYYDFMTREGESLYVESFAPALNGGKGLYLWAKASPLYDPEGNLTGAIETLRDITSRKDAEEKLKYLSLHDALTGLYNRAYFEEEIRRLEASRHSTIGIIVCDVDGLKLLNDTLGHEAGDMQLKTVADLLKSCFRHSDVVARVGGDEFAVLLPEVGEAVLEILCQRIRQKVESFNSSALSIPISISLGYAVGKIGEVSLKELYKQADNHMYREKLHRSQSAKSAVVKALLKAIEARDFSTHGHASRLQYFVNLLARSLGLPEHRINDLKLLAEFHDIGKVGIPDRILFKPGKLTPQEKAEMERHAEIGYRIALSSPDLAPIADLILKHHEWWNGEGYPLGLRGYEIPLECRILAIADAYDAMTSDRPYRKAMSHEEAIEELLRCSGKQFDPFLVPLFAQILNEIRQKTPIL